MSEPLKDPSETPVKVHDKRRFHTDGAPKHDVASPAAPEIDPPAAKEAPPVPSPEAQEIERLTRELEAARKRVNDFAVAIQAGERDREAFKQRLTREREQMMDVERGTAAQAVLEAVDELDLCMTAQDDSPLAKGVRLVRDNLLRKAASTGIERVEMDGLPYDPNLAEANDMEITAVAADDNKVLATLKGCYRLKGRVIRPGRVKVAKYVKPAHA